MQAIESKPALNVGRFSPWLHGLARLIPLWMMALATSAEGFPRPFLPSTLGVVLFWATIPVGIWIVVKGWAWLEILLIGFVPFFFFILFDEITTTYKMPFIFFCTLILSVGLVFYEPFTRRKWRWIILVGAVILALWAANHAANNFWAYHEYLGVGECFLDAVGCPQLPTNHPAWWSFFLSP